LVKIYIKPDAKYLIGVLSSINRQEFENAWFYAEYVENQRKLASQGQMRMVSWAYNSSRNAYRTSGDNRGRAPSHAIG